MKPDETGIDKVLLFLSLLGFLLICLTGVDYASTSLSYRLDLETVRWALGGVGGMIGARLTWLATALRKPKTE